MEEMKKFYKSWNPRAEAKYMIMHAQDIILEYKAKGYILTLRQLYYQFVAKGLLEENSDKMYKMLGTYINRARMAGMISWEAIEDRNRGHIGYWYDEDIMNPIRDLPTQIRYDRWDRQEWYIEVWVEKEALGNVVSRACRPLLVPYLSCKGYLSASEAWRAGRRFKEKLEFGHKCLLIHLGDHDPSGIDMTRDNKERLDMFTEKWDSVQVERIALNMDQIRKYKPAPNPAKLTDTRSKGYRAEYGPNSWELDALDPQIIENMITEEIEHHIDWDSWEQAKREEFDAKAKLSNVYDRWEEIKPIVERR